MDNTQDQTVGIAIPDEQTGLSTEQETISNPQSEVPGNQPQSNSLSTTNPQSDVWLGDSCTTTECEHYTAWLKSQVTAVTSDNVVIPEKKPNPVGRPCEFCKNKEKYETLTRDYLKRSRAKTGDKVSIPFIEELADILDKDDETLGIWAHKHIKDQEGKETEELEHPEFAHLFKRIVSLQKLRLLQRTLGRFNPSGAIFQLKANHGLIETEKKVLAGDSNEPLLVEIINEDRKNLENE